MSVSRITEIPWDSNIDLQINLANESAAPFCRSATEDVDHYRLFLTWKTRESISWRKGISGLCRGELKGSTRNEGSHWNQKWMSRIHRSVRKKEKKKERKMKKKKETENIYPILWETFFISSFIFIAATLQLGRKEVHWSERDVYEECRKKRVRMAGLKRTTNKSSLLKLPKDSSRSKKKAKMNSSNKIKGIDEKVLY